MNFVAIIGIVQEIKQEDKSSVELKVKVEKPFYKEDEQWYDVLSVKLDKELFEEDLKTLTEGMIVGVKGRINPLKASTNIICERLQSF
jgi:hypothetical protein